MTQSAVEKLANVVDDGRRKGWSALHIANDGMLAFRHDLREALIRHWSGTALKRDEQTDLVLDELYRGVQAKVTA